MARSMLSDYLQQYGSRLQSFLHSPVTGQVPATLSDAAAQPAAPMSALRQQSSAPVQGTAPTPQSDSGLSSEGSGEYSFSAMWQRTSDEERDRFTKQLEAQLKRGNQTIDSAYDEMIRQLGARPAGKLSRQDKAALLMEFGLSLMANAARYGENVGGAIGAAGLQTLGRYQQLTTGRQQEYDAKVAAINTERAKAKSALAEKFGLEGVKGQSEIAKAGINARQKDLDAQRRASEISGTVTTEGGDVYGYTRSGRTSLLRDEGGQPIKERPKSEPLVPVIDENGNAIYVPRSEAAGRRKPPPASAMKGFQLKASDTNAIYRQAAGLFGGMYDPITGRIAGLNPEQAETVQRIAARASQLFMEGEGKVDHATAVEQAFEEARSGKLNASRAQAPTTSVTPTIPPDAPRKTIGGKTYVKIGDTWYAED